MARANRDYLRGLYATIKDSDSHVRFTFLTGVSKFSKVSLFSGLNNLQDITLDPRYSAICGYTDPDLDEVFAPELPGLKRDEIRDWYNGYDWLGEERVYNPFDILLLFDKRQFDAHWFETGTPTFLVETLCKRNMAVLFNGTVYLIEFKVVELAPDGAAMAQLKEKRYADKYRALGRPIYLIAAEFSKDARNLAAFDVERA